MKFRVILASVIAAVLVAGGIGTAAYYSMARPNSTVEVVPVANVNYPDMGYFDYDDMIYGTVTSSVSQTVVLDDEYAVDQIYVSEGQEVTEGTPLFSYDMTMAELELEMKEIELQVQQLTLTKLNKELESYKNGTYRETADLEENEDFDDDTLSAAEEFIIEDADSYEPDDSYSDSADSYSAEPEITYSDEIIVEDAPVIYEDSSSGSDSQSADSSDSISIEGIEVTGSGDDVGLASDNSTETETEKEVPESITKFETLIDALRSLIDAYEDDLISSDIEDAILLAVQYYRENLADEVEVPEEDEDEPRYYVLKTSLEEELSASEYAKLESYVKHMEKYHAYYVDLLIKEAVNASEEDQPAAIEKAREAYDDLSGDALEYVKNLSALEELENSYGIKTYEEEVTISIENAIVSGIKDTYEYTGSDIVPDISVKLDGDDNPLIVDIDYEVNIVNNLDPGTATVTITGIGKYNGEITKKFEIVETDNDDEPETESPYSSLIEDFCVKREMAVGSQSAEKYHEAIYFYQDNLSSIDSANYMEDYQGLKSGIIDFLNDGGDDETGVTWDELETWYKDLCFEYVEYLITSLYAKVDEEAGYLTGEDLTNALNDLDAAQTAFNNLGETWTEELGKKEVKSDETYSDDAILSIEDPTKEYASLSDILSACEMILAIDDLYNTIIDLYGDIDYADFTVEEILGTAEMLYADYELLSSAQKALVWNVDLLEEILGISELVEEEETDDYYDDDWDDDDWGDDWGDDYDYDDDVEQEIIFLEQQIKECELDIKEIELEIEQDQRVVDGKVVKSTLNGVVVSIGTDDGSSDDEYFVKVSSTSGLYAKGVISELELDTVNVGDLISGVSEDDVSFVAEIKEVADYPDPEGSEMTYGSGNSNVSYYPFYALIEDSEDIDEGDAELELDTSLAVAKSGSIYLESYFVRKDSSGNSYVYIADENGLLKKKNVTVGRTYYDYWIEITSGLKTTDLIAFPYGDKVKEGVATKEVEFLDEGYE